ncbi:MBL fold metallo-hydrolase [Anaeromyxobacter sp. Fw109-5]|uniref:MBL fold metallo-hydrolase n=1 Tax=Anaeromyxobacter sp. (strain Fw109-5) TaxID=404589 RepID=UPI0000ED7BE0|nr:MBL fold metallo-hydrolase [Anaeromyxobacter sp. Fw109-5]ABS24271.1 beta-lactamase domain protein [Anaeromyxobacter sp. Fw109-5]
MTEADLAALGVHRIAVPIPFPQAGGPVNVYAIEEAGGGLVLFDSGFSSAEAHAALEDGFRRIGRRFDEVTRIVVSHGHVDHYGGARHVQELHGGTPPVYAHPADLPKVTEEGWRWREHAPAYAAHLARLGLPEDVIAATAAAGEKSFELAPRVPEARPLAEGERLRARHLDLEVLHMPGHTPGLVCLYDRARRLFLSDDHLLQKISPNPLIELGPHGEEGYFRPLLAYLDSVRRLHALDVDLVLPGHGPPFSGHRAVIDRLVEFYGKRQARLRELLAAGPRTAWELCRTLFPWAKPAEAFLTISETAANLELLEARGEVARTEVAGRWSYALAR